MNIIFNEKDLYNLNEEQLSNFTGIISSIAKHAYAADKTEAVVSDEVKQAKPSVEEAVKAEVKEKDTSKKKAESKKESPKKEAPKSDDGADDDMDLGLDEPEEEKSKKKRTRKEMFTALQNYCKADKDNAGKVRGFIKELGIAKVTEMTDEQMKQICDDLEI